MRNTVQQSHQFLLIGKHLPAQNSRHFCTCSCSVVQWPITHQFIHPPQRTMCKNNMVHNVFVEQLTAGLCGVLLNNTTAERQHGHTPVATPNVHSDRALVDHRKCCAIITLHGGVRSVRTPCVRYRNCLVSGLGTSWTQNFLFQAGRTVWL